MSYFMNVDVFSREDMSDIPSSLSLELSDGTPLPRVGEVVFFGECLDLQPELMGTVRQVVHSYERQQYSWVYLKCIVYKDPDV